MRKFLFTLVLVAIATYAQASTSGQSPSIDGVCRSNKLFLASSPELSTTLQTTGTATVFSTAGQYRCGIIETPCTMLDATKISFEIGVGLASSQGEVGIFDEAGTTRLTSSGVKSTAAAGAIDATGLSVFTVTGLTRYLICIADSAVGTVTFRNTLTNQMYGSIINIGFVGGTLATEVAPFNAACTAGSTPYTCCTGLGTGTCNGMADRTGVPSIVANLGIAGPLIAIGK